MTRRQIAILTCVLVAAAGVWACYAFGQAHEAPPAGPGGSPPAGPPSVAVPPHPPMPAAGPPGQPGVCPMCGGTGKVAQGMQGPMGRRGPMGGGMGPGERGGPMPGEVPSRERGEPMPGEDPSGRRAIQMPAEDMERFAGMVGHLTGICFDSHAVGIMAVGALKDEVRRKPADAIKDLEDQLAATKSLGLRNAIRLTLKDLYKRENDDGKVLEQLRALIAENDKALQATEKK